MRGRARRGRRARGRGGRVAERAPAREPPRAPRDRRGERDDDHRAPRRRARRRRGRDDRGPGDRRAEGRGGRAVRRRHAGAVAGENRGLCLRSLERYGVWSLGAALDRGDALGARAERIAAIESGAERPHPVPLERSEAETAVLTGDGAGVSPPHGSAPPALRSPVAGTSIVTTAPAPRSATRSAVVVVALAAAVAGGAWWLAGRRALGDAPTSTASATAPASAPAHPTPLLSSPPAVEPAPEQASPAPTADPATSARAVLQPRSAASARPGCIPPYAWDPVRKIKVYKEHCFK